jgi:hypothetical protein
LSIASRDVEIVGAVSAARSYHRERPPPPSGLSYATLVNNEGASITPYRIRARRVFIDSLLSLGYERKSSPRVVRLSEFLQGLETGMRLVLFNDEARLDQGWARRARPGAVVQDGLEHINDSHSWILMKDIQRHPAYREGDVSGLGPDG